MRPCPPRGADDRGPGAGSDCGGAAGSADQGRTLDSADRGGARALADDLQAAESAAVAFIDELRGRLDGWRQAPQVYVDPALVLAFLLHPGQVRPPDSNGDAEAGELFGALWQRVGRSEGPLRAGHAAAVHAATGTVRTMAENRRAWRGELDLAHTDLDKARNRWALQIFLHVAKILMFVGAIALIPIGFTNLGYVRSTDPASTTSAFNTWILWEALLFGGAIAIATTTGGHNGFRTRRHAAQAGRAYAAARVEELRAGIAAGDEELRLTREICGR
ncbi:hypothetical protein HNR23_001322 [Nocardiopsis mwathae]|uniref:Uncharacterized protein n=1 Tax=Nocardiopsis mwathae TaxID=1472723 RepID=A0A7W9YFR1_9ACTN|nr:hypothetical protein [Nocardiopsis mwathae]MBB6171262.1 hypothetical protein [Nocardiopsis mwathae]